MAYSYSKKPRSMTSMGGPGDQEGMMPPMEGDAEMMPPEGEMPPMEGEAEMMPPMEGEMPPEAEDPQMQQMMAIAESAPVPSKPYSIKVIDNLVDQFNDTLSKLGGGDIPEIAVDLSGAEKNRWDQQLPPELFLPLVAISEATKVIGAGEFEGKYYFDPMELDSDTQLRKATAQLKRMGSDKKFIAAFEEPPGEMEAPEEAEMPPPVTEAMSEEDQTLAAGMETSAPA